MGNTYERLINYDPKDVSKIFGEVAESWTVSPDGKTLTFKIRPGQEIRLRQPDHRRGRGVLAAAGRHPRQVAGLHHRPVRPDEGQRRRTRSSRPARSSSPWRLDKAYAPTFVLYCLTATVASVVDKKLAMANEKDGDFGYGWLKTRYAGSGPVQDPRLEGERGRGARAQRQLRQEGAARPRRLPAHEGDRDAAPAAREGRRRHRAQPRPGGDRGRRARTRTSRSTPAPRARSTISASTRRTRTWPSPRCARR